MRAYSPLADASLWANAGSRGRPGKILMSLTIPNALNVCIKMWDQQLLWNESVCLLFQDHRLAVHIFSGYWCTLVRCQARPGPSPAFQPLASPGQIEAILLYWIISLQFRQLTWAERALTSLWSSYSEIFRIFWAFWRGIPWYWGVKCGWRTAPLAAACAVVRF